MRKTALLLIICTAFAAACGDAGKVPKGVLSKDQMKEILIDMNMADAYGRDIAVIDTVPLTDSVRELRVKTYYTQVLLLHKVTVKQFMDSYRFYETRPDLYEEVLKKMMEEVTVRKAYEDTLEVRRQRVISDSLNKVQKKIDDSLKAVKKLPADSIAAKTKAMADSLAAARKRAGLDSLSKKKQKTLKDSLLRFHKRQQDSLKRLLNKRSAI